MGKSRIPLISNSEIKDTVEHFLKKKLDTLISSDERKVHFDLDGKAMNTKKMKSSHKHKISNQLIYLYIQL